MVVTNPRNAPSGVMSSQLLPMSWRKETQCVLLMNVPSFDFHLFFLQDHCSFLSWFFLGSLPKSAPFSRQDCFGSKPSHGLLPSPCQNFLPRLILLPGTNLLEEMFPCWLILYLRIDFIAAACLLSVPRNLSAEGESNQTQC